MKEKKVDVAEDWTLDPLQNTGYFPGLNRTAM